MYAVIQGNPCDGIAIWGPFVSLHEAQAKANDFEYDRWVVEMTEAGLTYPVPAFKLGQPVWMMLSNAIVQGIVCRVFTTSDMEVTSISYSIVNKNGSALATMPESGVFRDKESLLASL